MISPRVLELGRGGTGRGCSCDTGDVDFERLDSVGIADVDHELRG